MRLAGAVLSATLVASICLALVAGVGLAGGRQAPGQRATVTTDGRLRPGHLEVIRVKGFPGRGLVDISFFPTAICEDGCGAPTRRGGWTDANGEGRFEVPVPGAFLDSRQRHAYFRDRERIDVEVTWEGANHSFVPASASPEPIMVRSHRG